MGERSVAPRRGRPPWLIPAVAIVVIVLVLAALVASLVFPRPGAPTGEPPTVVLAYPSGCGPVTIAVEVAASAVSLSSFDALAYRNGAVIGRIDALSNGAMGGSLSFSDADADGHLSLGDRFTVSAVADGAYEMPLLWHGVEVSRAYWSLPPRPAVNLTGSAPIADGFSVGVASASCEEFASEYRVNVQENATVSPTKTLAPNMSFTVGGDTLTVAWNDSTGDGRLNAGDGFGVARPGGLPPETAFALHLLWIDGGTVATGSYQTQPFLLVVTLGLPLGGATVTVDVQSASPSLQLSAFAATLVRGNETDGDLSPLADGATNGSLSFADRDADGHLSAGDRFTATRIEAGFYTLKIWYGPYQVGEQGWGETPVVALGSPVVGPGYVQLVVAGASPPTRLSEFSASVTLNGTEIGRIDALGLPGSGNLSFTDIDGGGKLTAGDFFRVASLVPGAYELILRWQGPGFGLRIVTRATWTM